MSDTISLPQSKPQTQPETPVMTMDTHAKYHGSGVWSFKVYGTEKR